METKKRNMKTPSILSFLLLVSLNPVAIAREMPSACEEKGLPFFHSATEYLFLERACKEIVPDSSAGFSRVLERYESESPACMSAVRSMPELERSFARPDVQSFVQDFKSGKLDPEQIGRATEMCLGIERSDDERRALEKNALELFPPWPSPGGG